MSDDTIEIALYLELTGGSDEDLERETRQLYSELQGADVKSVKTVTTDSTLQRAKSVDPMLLGALVIAVGPAVLTKFLEFLHAWAMRKEGRVIKIKVQTEAGSSIEVEVPASMSPDEVRNWVNAVSTNITNRKRRGRS